MGRGFGRLRVGIAAGALLLVLLVVPAGTAAGPVFEPGDLVVNSGGYGSLTWVRADGSVVKPLDAGFSDASGAEFDPTGRLWVVSIGQNKAVAFDREGNSLGTIVPQIHDPSTDGGNPTDIAFDAKGNAYIGAYEYEGPVTKFSPSGAPLGVVAGWEADHLDLAADQCTLYLQHGNAGLTYFKNACTNAPMDDSQYLPSATEFFDLSEAFGMRILPDGSVLMAGPQDALAPGDSAVLRVGPNGNVITTYDTPGCAGGSWKGIALSPDGSRFWSSCAVFPSAPSPVEFDVASGAVVRTLPTPGIVQAVYGGFRAAQDRTAPTVTLTSPVTNSVFKLGQSVVAGYVCADTGGSDLASCAGNVPAGAPIDTSTVGAKTFKVTATDGAGNTASATASYQVTYSFTGFFTPIDNPATLNVMRAGKAVRIPFKLAGNRGLAILEPGYPQAHTITCDPGAPQDTVEKTANASTSRLTYEPKPQQYVYQWATSTAWRGTCKDFVLKLNDGTEHHALFKFT